MSPADSGRSMKFRKLIISQESIQNPISRYQCDQINEFPSRNVFHHEKNALKKIQRNGEHSSGRSSGGTWLYRFLIFSPFLTSSPLPTPCYSKSVCLHITWTPLTFLMEGVQIWHNGYLWYFDDNQCFRLLILHWSQMSRSNILKICLHGSKCKLLFYSFQWKWFIFCTMFVHGK